MDLQGKTGFDWDKERRMGIRLIESAVELI